MSRRVQSTKLKKRDIHTIERLSSPAWIESKSGTVGDGAADILKCPEWLYLPLRLRVIAETRKPKGISN